MSAETPLKSPQTPESVKTYSRVVLPESPVAASPQKNLTGLPRVARDIAADVYNNIQKWNDRHIKGAQILKEIASLKAESTVMFPDGLEPLLSELYDIVQTLSIYSKALIFLTSQMKSISKLHHPSTPLFTSLTIDQLIKLVEDIAVAYKNEMKVKEYTLENIAYSRDKHEVMFHAACWAHQRFIIDQINLKLEALLTETGHRQCT